MRQHGFPEARIARVGPRGPVAFWPFATYCNATRPSRSRAIAEIDRPTPKAEGDAHDPQETLDFDVMGVAGTVDTVLSPFIN